MREGHRPLEPAAARVRENQIWCALVSLACELTAWAQLLAFTTPDSANRSRPARRGAGKINGSGSHCYPPEAGLAQTVRCWVLHYPRTARGPRSPERHQLTT